MRGGLSRATRRPSSGFAVVVGGEVGGRGAGPSARRSALRSLSTATSSTASAAFVDPYNAIVTRPSLPEEQASSTQRAESPPDTRPLAGLRVSIKHNFLTADMPTTAASRMLASNFQPHFDATAVRLLRDAGGATIVGKTNCDEFGMGSANVHSVYGPVINPAGPESHRDDETEGGRRARVAGGSSGGAAASAASGQCDLALASDTGGSIRLPASYCGVWGLKPSYGRISRWGLIAYADSLDTVGLVGKSLEHVRRAWGVLDVVDPRDPTAVGRGLRERAAALGRRRLGRIGLGEASTSLKGLVVGVPREYFPVELSPAVVRVVRQTLRRLRDAGATIEAVSMPHTERTLGAYYVLASAEAASNLARYDGVRYGFRKDADSSDVANGEHPYSATRSEGFGAEVQRRILLGTYALSAGAFDNYFLKAQRIRRLVQADFDRVFAVPNVLRSDPALDLDSSLSSANTDGGGSSGVDVLIHPSAIGIAPLLPTATGSEPDDIASLPVRQAQGQAQQPGAQIDASSSYVQDVLTVPASLAGVPALSMPLGQTPEDDAAAEAAAAAAAGGERDGEGWPVGVSAVAQWGCEEVLWRVAGVLDGAVADS